MKYVNNETGLEIDLSELSDKQKNVYRGALKKFQTNMDWLEFDRDFFKPSIMYSMFDKDGERLTGKQVLACPLYRAIRNMFIQLGVQQGKIKRKNKEEK